MREDRQSQIASFFAALEARRPGDPVITLDLGVVVITGTDDLDDPEPGPSTAPAV